MYLQCMKQLLVSSIAAISLQSIVTLHAKPAVATAAESIMHNSFIYVQ